MTKLYTTLEELEEDNSKEIFVDREYDNTNYELLSEYGSEQSKLAHLI